MIPTSSDSDAVAEIAIGTAAIAATGAIAAWLLKKKRQKPGEPDQFTNEQITSTFIAAIPTITRELNLEVATTHQIEVFEKANAKQVLGGWFDLGTNVAILRVPVTYRYHIRLYDAWILRVIGNTLVVEAPLIRASLPPAIHTDEIVTHAVRGWGRGSPNDLIAQLQREMTPTLSQYAGDTKRIALIQETCRQSIGEFVRGWLDGNAQWGMDRFTAVQVRFPEEPELPPTPTLKLLS